MKDFKKYLEVIQESKDGYNWGIEVPQFLYKKKINVLTDDEFKQTTDFIDYQLKNQQSDLAMRNLYLLIKKLKQSSKNVDKNRKSTLEKYSKKVLDKMTELIYQSLERYDRDDEGLGDFIKDKD